MDPNKNYGKVYSSARMSRDMVPSNACQSPTPSDRSVRDAFPRYLPGWLRILVWALALLPVVSCDPRAPGEGPHEYKTTPGSATVRALAAGDGVTLIVTFDFRPADPAAGGHCEGVKETLAADGPPLEWAQRKGIQVGKEIPCVRKDRIRGTTTPLVWEFPESK